MIGWAAGALLAVFGGSAAAVAVLIRRAPLYNETVTFAAVGDETERQLFWWCSACDGFGCVSADVVDGGGFNHTPSCPAGRSAGS